MRKVVVDMQNILFSDAIAQALRSPEWSFCVYVSEHPNKTLQMCSDTEADILIMEVTAYKPWRLEERIRIRDAVKNKNPKVRMLLWWMKTPIRSWRSKYAKPRKMN